MARTSDQHCPICSDPFRYKVEDEFLMQVRSGAHAARYTVQELERHASHVTDPETLRTVSNLSSATAVAARLRRLEISAGQIMDLAIATNDGKLAIAALREARQTITAMRDIADALDSQQTHAVERVDLDDLIADHLGGRHSDENRTRTAAEREANTQLAPARIPLALEAGETTQP